MLRPPVAVIQHAPILTFGDFVAATSEVAEVSHKDPAELLNALLTSGRARFVHPDALHELEGLSVSLRVPRRASQRRQAHTRATRHAS